MNNSNFDAKVNQILTSNGLDFTIEKLPLIAPKTTMGVNAHGGLVETTNYIQSPYFALLNTKSGEIINSVKKTKRLVVVDGDWSSCGLASEIITSVVESVNPQDLISKPKRVTLVDAPAPTSKYLENDYYISTENIIDAIKEIF